MNYCPHCGSPVSRIPPFVQVAGNRFSPSDSAGQTFNTPQTTKEKEDRWLIALVLCIVLGGFGVHRFYTGNTTTGIIMLDPRRLRHLGPDRHHHDRLQHLC